MRALLLYSLSVVAVTWVAGLLPLASSRRLRTRDFVTAFAGGVLLGAAFLHMLPEAAEHSPRYVGAAVLGGLLFVFLLERLIATHYCEHDLEACNHFQMIGYTFYIGLTIHSFIDGVVLASGSLIPRLGPLVFLAIVAHHVPVVFSLSSILVEGGFRQKRVLVLIGLLSLSTPAGALLAFGGLSGLSHELQSLAVAVSAGTFVYIALTDLLPSIAHERHNWPAAVFALSLGLALMYGAGQLTSALSGHL